MARPSVEDHFEGDQSPYPPVTPDPVTYPELPPRIAAYLRTDSVRNRRQSMPASTVTDGPTDAQTPWDIKNAEQLSRWAEEDPDRFVEVFKELRTQRDLGVEACDLFDKIPSEQIWKARYEEIDATSVRFDKESQKIQDKLTEAQSQLRVARDVTPAFSSFFSFTKRSQKC